MGTTTTNLGLYKPAISEVGWGALVDANFDTLDAAITSQLYVRPTGSNSNTGLSWGKAKLDVLGAWDALPSGGGVIYFETGSYVNDADHTAGLRIAGSGDSQYASLPAGWRQHKPFQLIGIPSTDITGQGHYLAATLNGGSNADTNHPLIWLSGTQGPSVFQNIGNSSQGKAVELGLDSTGAGATNNAFQTFDRCQFRVENGAALGPCVNITASYWTYFRDCELASNEQVTHTSDLRAAILVSGSSVGHGLIWVSDTNFEGGGGIKVKTTTGGTNIVLENCVQEGPSFPASVSAPLMWSSAVMDSAAAGAIILRSIEQADARVGSDAAVIIAEGTDPGVVLCQGVNGTIQGPATIVGQGPTPGKSNTYGPARYNNMGFVRGRVVGSHDGTRRTFGFAGAAQANLANQDTSTWGAVSGAATVTTGQSAPDGSTNAAKLTAGSQQERQVYRTSRALVVGDWMVVGCWVKGDGTDPVGSHEVGLGFNGASAAVYADGLSTINLDIPQVGEGEWQWVWGAKKIASVSATPAEVILALRCDSAKARYYYAPMLLHIPTGTYADSEVMEIAQNLMPYPETAIAGQVALLRGQSVHIPSGYVEMTAITAPTAPTALSTRGRLYMDTSGGKQRLMILFDSGAAQVVATEP